MISGQQAQAAGGDRNAFMQTEFSGGGGEPIASSQSLGVLGPVSIGFLKPGLRGKIMIEGAGDPIHMSEEAVVADKLVVTFLFESGQQFDRAVVDKLDPAIIDAAKESDGF